MIGGMPEIARTTVGLRIFGDALDPDEITRLLGVDPSGYARKDATHLTASGRQVVARSGSWRLDAGVPGNLDTQVGSLLTSLPSDPTIWRGLTANYRCDVFCGLFLREGNGGAELSPRVMSLLGERGLRLSLDIYDIAD